MHFIPHSFGASYPAQSHNGQFDTGHYDADRFPFNIHHILGISHRHEQSQGHCDAQDQVKVASRSPDCTSGPHLMANNEDEDDYDDCGESACLLFLFTVLQPANGH